MSLSTKQLERLLDKSEFDLVARTRSRAIGDVPDADLPDLAKTLRERRDKARDRARRQRREFRGKVAPQGTEAASGTKAKADALTVALKRVGAEQTRRTEKLHQPSQRSLARKALALKQRQQAAQRPTSRTADTGMKSVTTRKTAKSGALDHGGQRSAMHRSKFAR